jgi:hypothetical protein
LPDMHDLAQRFFSAAERSQIASLSRRKARESILRLLDPERGLSQGYIGHGLDSTASASPSALQSRQGSYISMVIPTELKLARYKILPLCRITRRLLPIVDRRVPFDSDRSTISLLYKDARISTFSTSMEHPTNPHASRLAP